MKDAIIDALLGLAVLTAWIGAFGLVMLRTPLARLHAGGQVVVTAGFFVCLALIVAQPFTAAALKTIFIFAILLGTNAVLTHAIGRAIRLRDESTDTP